MFPYLKISCKLIKPLRTFHSYCTYYRLCRFINLHKEEHNRNRKVEHKRRYKCQRNCQKPQTADFRCHAEFCISGTSEYSHNHRHIYCRTYSDKRKDRYNLVGKYFRFLRNGIEADKRLFNAQYEHTGKHTEYCRNPTQCRRSFHCLFHIVFACFHGSFQFPPEEWF